MKLNKIIIDIAVITIAFLFFIIWHQNSIENSAQTTLSNIKYYEVYLITTDKGYQYWNTLNQGAADMAAAVGIKYFWEAPAVRSTEQQIEIINKAVESGADALLVAADDPKWISGAIEDAKARGVKVIYVDSPAYEEAITTLATDNYEAGVLAGQTMISILDEMEIKSGSIGIINLAAKENTKLRESGFRDTFAQDVRFKILETIYTETDIPELTQRAAERMINENEDLVALFGTSEGTSIGVGNAIKANDNRYVGVGFDKTDDMMRLLREDSLKAIIDQNPYTMGYLGMAQAVAAILGKDTGPEYIDTGVSVVKKR
jgi:ribose transport system substrate-binding protein